MVGRKNREGIAIVFGLIVMGVSIAALLYLTVRSGFRREWFRMGFCLTLFVFVLLGYISILLDLRILSYFRRLEDVFSRKLDAPLRHEASPVSLIVPLVIFEAVIISLSLLAGIREQWLVLSVFLAVFVVGSYVAICVKTAIKVKACCKRLEELILKNTGEN
ncbi:MAG: hypothetical protein CEE38_22940 [Planctomycetes bacterium B3_Pla]|nr:MAG: hypothetical protein CEE38_22940 [Planctomycetes bacterium B3_Pla]